MSTTEELSDYDPDYFLFPDLRGRAEMRLRAYQIVEEKLLQEMAVGRPPLLDFVEGNQYWMDVEDADREELEQLISPLDLHAVITERCLETEGVSCVIARDLAVYVEIPISTETPNYSLAYLGIAITRDALITIHKGTIPWMADFAEDFTEEIRLNDASITSLLFHIFERSLDLTFAAAKRTREDTEQLVATLVNEPTAIALEDFMALRQRLMSLVVIEEDCSYCVETLVKLDSTAFKPGAQRESYLDLLRGLDRLSRALERLQTNVRNMFQYFQVTQQEKTNNRLRFLTIISAIFLPLTLIAGIYGMNFPGMPELQWGHGYFIVLGIMGAVTAGLLAFFYMKRWFD